MAGHPTQPNAGAGSNQYATRGQPRTKLTNSIVSPAGATLVDQIASTALSSTSFRSAPPPYANKLALSLKGTPVEMNRQSWRNDSEFIASMLRYSDWASAPLLQLLFKHPAITVQTAVLAHHNCPPRSSPRAALNSRTPPSAKTTPTPYT